jgi:hypothetical protein
MRPIDADALEPKFVHGRWDDTYVSETELMNAPTLDVIERKRGGWIHDGCDIPHGVDWMRCSVCGRREPHILAAMTNFCPNCGAEMKEVGK